MMATAKLPKPEMTFEEAVEVLSRQERFMATVSAMNALLIRKGVYSAAEFESVFTQWAANEMARSAPDRKGRPNR
jgi:hypothetical protein